jgi:hypothetical protein
MAPPVLSLAAQRLYEQVAHLEVDGESEGWPWAVVCAALAAPIDPLYDLLFTTLRPWELAVDLDRAPDWILPWLGQFPGVAVNTALTPDLQREQIRDAEGRRRGTVPAIEATARLSLTGTRQVIITERQGSAYRYTVATRASETPDPTTTERQVRAQKPGALVMTYAVIVGGDFATLLATHTDFADVAATFATFTALRTDPSVT